MKCRKCGAEMPDGLLYCGKCRGNLKRQSSGSSFLFTKKMLPVWLGVLAAVALVVTGIFVIPGLLNETPNNPDPGNQDAAQIIERMKDLEDDFGFENAFSELTEKSITTIDGDTYYRMQQNYKGIPVYGRTVVCATDENGETIAVTGNVWDVDGVSDLSSTITTEVVKDSIDAYLTQEMGYESVSYSVPVPTKENLCIYNMGTNEQSYLAHCLYINGLEFVINAHTGEVLACQETINDIYGYLASDHKQADGFPVEPSNGRYELADMERKIFVRDLNRKSSKKIKNYIADSSPISSNDLIFGNTTEESQHETAVEFYRNLADIHDCLIKLCGYQAEQIFCFINDGYDSGENASGGRIDLKDGKFYGLLTVGYVTGVNDIDAIAHEYTHVMSNDIVGFCGNKTETAALNEGISDIFGEIIEPLVSKNMTTPDWKMDGDNISVYRNIANPRAHGYMENVDDRYTGDATKTYGYSTIISHAAYVMWRGIDDDPTTRLTTDELAKLWYRAMLMMPSDCNFAECRTLVELAGESMHLSDKKMQCIRAAFDNAGIPDERAVDYTIKQNAKLSVYGTNSELYNNYTATIDQLYIGGDWGKWYFILSNPYKRLYTNLTKDYSTVIDVSSSEPVELDLPEGLFAVTLQDKADSSKAYRFLIAVSESEGKDKLDIYTDFGTKQLDVTDPLTDTTEPSTSVTEPSTSVTEPSTSVTEPSTSVTEPSASVTEPSTSVTEPNADATEPSTSTTEPSTSVTEPSTSTTEPSTSNTADNSDQIYYIRTTQGFSDGVAWVETCKKRDGMFVDSQWVCIDTTGNVLFMLEPNTFDPSAYHNGVALYETYDSEYNVDAYVIIDKSGSEVFSSRDGVFDAVIAHNDGCFAVYTYSESFREAGYTVFFMNNRGEVTNQIEGLRAKIPELINCGEGVFAEKIWQNAAAEVTYRFYNAKTGSQYEIGEIGVHKDMKNIFHNGYAVIRGPRMGDIPRLVSTDGHITNLEYFGYGSFYDFGPVADGGFVCTSYYQDKAEHVWFYDIDTGTITPLGNYGERVKLSRAEDLFFDNGSMLLPLVGADGKNYYTIINKAGQSLFEPIVCESAYAEGDDRIVVKFTNKTVVYNGQGQVVFELPAGQGLHSYQNGVARLVWSNYVIQNTYIDLTGKPLFDDDILIIASRES